MGQHRHRDQDMTEPGEQVDIDDDLKWWVLVDAQVYFLNPEHRLEDAVATYEKVVAMAAAQGVGRARISIVRVGNRWGWANYTGS